MAKEKRCNYFDDNGRPRRLRVGTMGCPRDASACRFAHPHERDWEFARPSAPPRPDVVSDFDRDFYYILGPPDRRDREREKRDRDWERDWKTSPHRRDSTITRGSPGPSSRRSTLDTSSGTTKRARSPTHSISSDYPETLRKEDKYSIRDHSRRDHAPSSSHRSHSRDKRREQDRADLPTKTHLFASLDPHSSVASFAQLPPLELPQPPPMQPLPPLPELPKLPSFVSTQQSHSSAGTTPRGLKELSTDEQRLAWHERIDLMLSSIVSRRDYTKLESDLAQTRQLSNTPLVSNMPEADRANITAHKMALELEMEIKRKEINEIIQKLIASEFWPVLRSPQISEMERSLGEAKKHVLEVKGLLEDVKNSCTALFKASSRDWVQGSERPSKCRRLEGTADVPSGSSTSGNAEDMSGGTAMELEVFRDKLTKLDRHLSDIENDITQRDNIISDEIELHIDARLETEDALYPAKQEPGGPSQAEIEALVDAKNTELARAVAITGEEIGVLAMEVAELITKVNGLEAKCKALEVENVEFKNKLAQDTLDHAKSQEALVRRDNEVEAIAAALQAYISQAPAGQTADDLPSAEYIIESLDCHLDSLFREKFCTTLVNIQQDVYDKVQESHNQTLNTISPKIMLLLKMVSLITARVGSDAEHSNAG